MNIVFLSDIAWSGLHQRPQHLALALAKRWNVLWVEPATLLKPVHYHPVRVAPGISVISVPAIPYNARYRVVQLAAKPLSRISLLRHFLLFIQVRLIRRALRAAATPDEPVAVIVQNFHLVGAAERLGPSFLLYDYIDNAFGFTGMPEHIRREWLHTLEKADVVTVTSPGLEEQIRPHRTGPVLFVGNGVEYDHFAAPSPRPVTAEFPEGKPVVGYAGAIYQWFDYDLLGAVARIMPDCNFVLIGPVHPQTADAVSLLQKLGNVFPLGFKSYADLPSYLRRFNAGIIPFLVNDLTKSVNPVKLYEYSAAGVPTVATDFSADIRACRDVVRIASTPEAFAAAVRSAIAERNDPAAVSRLREFARQNDWNARTGQIIGLIDELLSHRVLH